MKPYKECHTLMDAFGSDLILADEDDHEEHYRVVTELEVDHQHYAILQLHGDPDEDVYLFRVLPDEEGIAVEDVEDDEEWERVADVCRHVILEQ